VPRFDIFSRRQGDSWSRSRSASSKKASSELDETTLGQHSPSKIQAIAAPPKFRTFGSRPRCLWHRRVSTGHNGEDGRSHFAGFWLRHQRIGTRRNLTCSRRCASIPMVQPARRPPHGSRADQGASRPRKVRFASDSRHQRVPPAGPLRASSRTRPVGSPLLPHAAVTSSAIWSAQ
jgi:hypothetical protein